MRPRAIATFSPITRIVRRDRRTRAATSPTRLLAPPRPLPRAPHRCRPHGDADVAAASAGASLMPSPTLATPPAPGELADESELVLGQQFGMDLHAERPCRSLRHWRGCRRSASRSDAEAATSLSPASASARGSSRKAMSPRPCPWTSRTETLLPSSSSAARSRTSGVVDPEPRRCAYGDDPAIDPGAQTPLPGSTCEWLAAVKAMPRSFAWATIATASGCDEPGFRRGRDAQHFCLIASRKRHDVGHFRLALGKGAGLVEGDASPCRSPRARRRL